MQTKIVNSFFLVKKMDSKKWGDDFSNIPRLVFKGFFESLIKQPT